MDELYMRVQQLKPGRLFECLGYSGLVEELRQTIESLYFQDQSAVISDTDDMFSEKLDAIIDRLEEFRQTGIISTEITPNALPDIIAVMDRLVPELVDLEKTVVDENSNISHFRNGLVELVNDLPAIVTGKPIIMMIIMAVRSFFFRICDHETGIVFHLLLCGDYLFIESVRHTEDETVRKIFII